MDKEEIENDSAEIELNKDHIERYCRQMILPEVLSKGQKNLINSKVLIVGAGGLGSSCIMYLAGSGVGTIGIVDGDKCELSNLHRQVIHTDKNKGINKAISAGQFIKSFNPLVNVKTYETFFSNENAVSICEEYNLIIDCSDNPATRYLISDTAVVLNIPLVSGSALRWDGQLTVLVTNKIKSKDNNLACYRCLFPVPSPATTLGSCSDEGVIGSVPGLIGILQATEAIKIIIDKGDTTLSNRMLSYDAMDMKFKTFTIKGKKNTCYACGETKTISKDSIKTFNYDEFASPKLCRVNKKANIPIENNKTWKEVIEYIEESPLIQDINNDCISYTKENILLDVRSEEQYNLFSLKNKKHIHIPFDCLQSKIDKDESIYLDLPKDKCIYVMCRSGNKSTYAVELLLKYGFKSDKVFNIIDGLQGYKRDIDSSTPFY